ncbi:MAG: hypothetical protein ACLP4V_23985 [Methylocella sp.]
MTTIDERNSEATGKMPTDINAGMAEPADGKAHAEPKDVAHEPRADTGNIEHGYGVAMTTDEIKKGWKNQ